MKHSDFRIGGEFTTCEPDGNSKEIQDQYRFRVTDIGTRVIVSIWLDKDDPSWYNGPPYAVAENVFDEYDMGGCYPCQ